MCRHPMQAGVLLLVAFSSPTYTIDRLIFVGVNTIGIILGVFMEDKRMSKKFSKIDEYKKEVPNMFIPDVRKLWKRNK